MSKLCSILSSNKGPNSIYEHRSTSLGIDKRRIVTTLIIMKQWAFLDQVIRDKPDCAVRCIEVIERGQQLARLPIHEICKHKPPLHLVRILVSAYPTSLLIKDAQNGSTALHFACRFGASKEVIEYLLMKYPDAANVEDKHGYTPLLLARRGSYKHKDVIIKLFDNLYLDDSEIELRADRHHLLLARRV